MEGRPVDELLDVTVERPALQQLQVEVAGSGTSTRDQRPSAASMGGLLTEAALEAE